MKKLLSLVLAGAMCLGLLSGCTSGKQPDPTNPPADKTDPPVAQSDASTEAPPTELTGTLKVAM